MKGIIPTLLAAVLTACGQSETPRKINIPTVEELASDPAQLKELRQQCRMERCSRSHTQAVLWRWYDAIYAVRESTQDVLTT